MMENDAQQCSSRVQKSPTELSRIMRSSTVGHKQSKVLHETSIAGGCKERRAQFENPGKRGRMQSGTGCIFPVHLKLSKRRRLEDASQVDRHSFEGNDGGQQLAAGGPISNTREDSCYHSDNQIRSEGEGCGSILNLSDQDGNDSNYVSLVEDDEMEQENNPEPNNSSEVANASNYVSLIEQQEATNNLRQPKAEDRFISSTETVHKNKENDNSSKDANCSNYVSLIEKQETNKTHNQMQAEEIGSEYLGIINYGNIVKYLDDSATKGFLDTEPQFSTTHVPGLFKFDFDHSVSSDSSLEDDKQEVYVKEETIQVVTDDPSIKEEVDDNLSNQENLSKSMDSENVNYFVQNSVHSEIKTTEVAYNDGLNKAEFSKPTDLDTNAYWPVHVKIGTTEDVNYEPPSKIKVGKSMNPKYLKSFVPDTSGSNKYPFVSMAEFNEILEKKFGPVHNEVPNNRFIYSNDESNYDVPEREIDFNQDPSYFDAIDDYPPIFPVDDNNFQSLKHPVDLPNLKELIINQERKEAESRKEEKIQDPTCGSSDNVYKRDDNANKNQEPFVLSDDSQESFVQKSIQNVSASLSDAEDSRESIYEIEAVDIYDQETVVVSESSLIQNNDNDNEEISPKPVVNKNDEEENNVEIASISSEDDSKDSIIIVDDEITDQNNTDVFHERSSNQIDYISTSSSNDDSNDDQVPSRAKFFEELKQVNEAEISFYSSDDNRHGSEASVTHSRDSFNNDEDEKEPKIKYYLKFFDRDPNKIISNSSDDNSSKHIPDDDDVEKSDDDHMPPETSDSSGASNRDDNQDLNSSDDDNSTCVPETSSTHSSDVEKSDDNENPTGIKYYVDFINRSKVNKIIYNSSDDNNSKHTPETSTSNHQNSKIVPIFINEQENKKVDYDDLTSSDNRSCQEEDHNWIKQVMFPLPIDSSVDGIDKKMGPMSTNKIDNENAGNNDQQPSEKLCSQEVNKRKEDDASDEDIDEKIAPMSSDKKDNEYSGEDDQKLSEKLYCHEVIKRKEDELSSLLYDSSVEDVDEISIDDSSEDSHQSNKQLDNVIQVPSVRHFQIITDIKNAEISSSSIDTNHEGSRQSEEQVKVLQESSSKRYFKIINDLKESEIISMCKNNDNRNDFHVDGNIQTASNQMYSQIISDIMNAEIVVTSPLPSQCYQEIEETVDEEIDIINPETSVHPKVEDIKADEDTNNDVGDKIASVFIVDCHPGEENDEDIVKCDIDDQSAEGTIAVDDSNEQKPGVVILNIPTFNRTLTVTEQSNSNEPVASCSADNLEDIKENTTTVEDIKVCEEIPDREHVRRPNYCCRASKDKEEFNYTKKKSFKIFRI